MEAAGEGSSQKGRNGGKKPVRKRKAKPQSATPLQKLRETVFPEPNTQATRKEVLQQAKHYILQLENTLDSLLKMKADILLEHSAPYSLEDVREEFLQLLSSEDGGASADRVDIEDIDPALLYLQTGTQDLEESVKGSKLENTAQSYSSPELLDFEKYLRFYKQTVDLLTESRVVSPAQVTHSAVSRAISSLWQELLQSGRSCSYQRCVPQDRTAASCSFSSPPDSGCTTNGGRRDSGAESQEASSSFLSSTPEDILMDDAFELAAGFLDQGANQTTPGPGSPLPAVSPWDSPEGEQQIHQYICDFLRGRFSLCPQAAAPLCDYETLLLRCTETFEDFDDI